jgi:probable rRNA maturation factor
VTGRGDILLSVEVTHPRAKGAARVLRAAARLQVSRLGSLGLVGWTETEARQLSILLVSDAGIRALNRRHRGLDRATDVLSFPQSEPAAAARARGPLGDVVISLPTALRQAEAGGWSLAAELRRLLAHGLLHCLGHDHERPAEARRMALAEEALLGRSGLVGDSLSGPKRQRALPPRSPG